MRPAAHHHDDDSIVISGAGLVCALGLSKVQAWEAIVENRCGIGPLTEIEQSAQCVKGGGQAPPLEADDDADGPSPREVRYLRLALREALDEASFLAHTPPPDRCGVVLGTTLGGMRAAGRFLRGGDLEHLAHFTAASIMQQALADLPLRGFATTTCSACASGLSSIAIATTLLRAGALDLVVAGGYDPISEYAYAGFNSLRLIAEGGLAPFSRVRDGMKLGEGYGVVVLERASSAAARGAAPLAHILGFGESSDAHHLTQPHPDGEGASRAMRAALASAALEPSAIDLIAAHATATPNNDAAERRAYRSVFGERLAQLPIVAFKSHLGHTLGAAGAVELILSMMALRRQCAPPTAGTSAQSIEFEDIQLLSEAEPRAINHTLNVSMGFGGANACIVLGRSARAAAPRPPRSAARAEPVITGVGLIAPGIIGNEQFAARVNDFQARLAPAPGGGALDEGELADLINARRARRMSEFAKLMLAAATVALRDAGINEGELHAFAADCNLVLGSAHGAVDFSEKYYRQVVEQGVGAANPMLFAEGVPNVASAQLSLMLNLRGSAQTIVGSRTAGLDALSIAMVRIRSGVWKRAIVGAAEEFHPLVNAAYEHCGSLDGRRGALSTSSGAVALLVECRAAAEARGARRRAILHDCGGRRWSTSSPARAAAAMDAICRQLGPAPQISSADGLPPETFSVGPLAGLAAMLLNPRAAGSRANIIAHDARGLACGVAVERFNPPA